MTTDYIFPYSCERMGVIRCSRDPPEVPTPVLKLAKREEASK